MPVELPKTPVGRHLGWVLDALRSHPSAEEVGKRFSRDFQKRTPPATYAQVLEQMGGELRGFVLERFEREAQRDLVAILDTPRGTYRLEIAVDDQRIDALIIRPTS
jgi:hypothetical protein